MKTSILERFRFRPFEVVAVPFFLAVLIVSGSSGVRAQTPQQIVQQTVRTLADVNGDDLTDIVVFATDGVYVAVSEGAGFAYRGRVLEEYGFDTEAGGWDVAYHLRLLADVNGDGAADIVGFGHFGVSVSLADGSGGFREGNLVLPEFGASADAGEWQIAQHPRQLADLNNDGCADILGFGNGGAVVALADCRGGFAAGALVLNFFGADGAWRIDRHPRELGDVNGDGVVDIVGFGEDGVQVALGRGDGSFNAPVPAVENFAAGVGDWDVNLHPRVLGDVNGDGRDDIIGFGADGVLVALGQENGTFGEVSRLLEEFGTIAGDWTADHIRQVGHINADDGVDIVGFGIQGVIVSLGRSTPAFEEPILALNEFGDAQDWDVLLNPRLLGDVNGDGLDDIVGFGEEGVVLALAAGDGGFAEPQRLLPEFGTDNLFAR